MYFASSITPDQIRTALSAGSSDEDVERFLGLSVPALAFTTESLGDSGLAAVAFARGLAPLGTLAADWPSHLGEPLVMVGAVDLAKLPPIEFWRSKPSSGWLCFFAPAVDSRAWKALNQLGHPGLIVNRGGGVGALRIVDDLGFDPTSDDLGSSLVHGNPVSASLLGVEAGWSLPDHYEPVTIDGIAVQLQLFDESDFIVNHEDPPPIQLFGHLGVRADSWAYGLETHRPFLLVRDDIEHVAYLRPRDVESNDFSEFAFGQTPA